MSARSLNKVMLIGNLTRDPEMRYTPQGTAVVTFGMATNRTWTPSDGGPKQEDTQFHRVVAWSKLAEICNQLLFKGRKVFIEGRLQTRKWTTQDGQSREATEVVAENMVVLDNRIKEGGAPVEEDFEAPVAAPEVANETVDIDTTWVDEVGEEAPKTEKSPKSAKKEEKQQEEVSADEIPF